MKDHLTKADVTPEVKASVAELLARMTVAKVTREKVDEVQAAILQYLELFTKPYPERGLVSERILDPSRSWRAEDGPALEAYYDTVDAALRAKGLKPDDMERDYCPALVAEHNQLKAEWALLDAAGRMLDMGYEDGELNDRLLCDKDGLSRRREFLDLMIKIVVNL